MPWLKSVEIDVELKRHYGARCTQPASNSERDSLSNALLVETQRGNCRVVVSSALFIKFPEFSGLNFEAAHIRIHCAVSNAL